MMNYQGESKFFEALIENELCLAFFRSSVIIDSGSISIARRPHDDL